MYTGKIFNERLKFAAFLLILASLTCLIVYELRYFSSSVLGGFTLYTLLRKPYKKLLTKGWKRLLAIAFLVTSTFLFIFVIGGGVTSVVYVKIKTFHPQVILENIRLFHQAIIQKFGYALFPEDILGAGVHWLGNALPGLLSATGNVIANVILMVFVLIFMLHGSEKFERGLENFLPVSSDSIRLLKKETSNMIISNAIGVPLIMFGQGSLAALAYWFTDAGDPVIWGMLTGFFGLIPVVGTATVWLPLSLNLLIGGHIWHGIILFVWSGCVVSFIDNAIRMVFLKKYANIHPLIPLFGVIVGINLFGFWGIIFGPLVLSGFLLLVKIFHREFLLNRNA